MMDSTTHGRLFNGISFVHIQDIMRRTWVHCTYVLFINLAVQLMEFNPFSIKNTMILRYSSHRQIFSVNACASYGMWYVKYSVCNHSSNNTKMMIQTAFSMYY